MQTVSSLVRNGSAVLYPIPAAPDPRFRYLRVEVAGNLPGLLVLGYVDEHPQGAIEVWYSANRETLKLQNGRIVATTGLPLDWAAVRFATAPPDWPQIPPEGTLYTRSRDELPRYRFGIAEQVRVQPLAGPAPYRWFGETVQPTAGAPVPALPPARFAWGRHRGVWTVVQSEQCLTPDFCLKLQRWPVQEEAP